jgi:hypothetical protein
LIDAVGAVEDLVAEIGFSVGFFHGWEGG